jgi:transcriptional regulator with XRE-family HTH domain
MGRRGVTITELAKKTGQSPQNMSNKMSRDNFSEKELKEIAAVLDCTFETIFKMNDTGEEI